MVTLSKAENGISQENKDQKDDVMEDFSEFDLQQDNAMNSGIISDSFLETISAGKKDNPCCIGGIMPELPR